VIYAAAVIFAATVYESVPGLRRWLRLDQLRRTAPGKALVGSTRAMAARDSTLLRALDGWDMKRLREAT
jgi:hypothetical protein